MTTALPLDQRRAALEREIGVFVREGFRVVQQTDTSAQLVKPKSFSLLWAVVWLLVLVIGLLIYLFYYMSKKDEHVYLTVDENGAVSAVRS